MWNMHLILVVRWLMGNDTNPVVPPPGSQWRLRAAELYRDLELPVPPTIGMKLTVPTNPEFQKVDEDSVESGVQIIQVTDLLVDIQTGGVTCVSVLQNNDPALSRQTAHRIMEWLVETAGFERSQEDPKVVPRISAWTAPGSILAAWPGRWAGLPMEPPEFSDGDDE